MIAILHYPPVLTSTPPSAFWCSSGKIRREDVCLWTFTWAGTPKGFEGEKNGVEYLLAAADYLSFKRCGSKLKRCYCRLRYFRGLRYNKSRVQKIVK